MMPCKNGEICGFLRFCMKKKNIKIIKIIVDIDMPP